MTTRKEFPCLYPDCEWIGTTFRSRRIHETKQHPETNKLSFIGRSIKLIIHKSVKSGKI